MKVPTLELELKKVPQNVNVIVHSSRGVDVIKWEFLRTKIQNYEMVPVVEKHHMSPYILTGFRTYGQMKHPQPVS